jgi:hypothetical protein
MEGHAEMDMSVTEGGSLWQRMTSDRGLTAISHYFVMDWAAVWLDIVGGLLIAGALAAWVPNPVLAILLPDRASSSRHVVGTDRRPAGGSDLFRLLGRQHSAGGGAVERRHQLRWGDRVHLRRPDRHPGPEYLSQVLRVEDAGFLFATFYVAMAVAALIVEVIFSGFALVPSEHSARVVEASITWDYTTWVNLAFLILAAFLVWRFLKTGGPAMLSMMNRPANDGHAHDYAH